jgi:hypothetical protein
VTYRHVRHSGTLTVDAPPDQAFPLFTAPGERLWVPGWQPRVVHGGDGRQRGAVFETDHDDERTIWVVADFDPRNRYARYVRVSPGSRAGTVEVRVRPAGGGSAVEISYDLAALGAEGNAVIEAFDAAAFEAMLAEWARLIRTASIDFGRIEELL